MKERILIIAPSVPLFDRNAGELRLFDIVEILAKSWDVLFFTNRIKQGKTLKEERYINMLGEFGVSVRFAGECSIREVLKGENFKATILEKYFVAEYYLPRIRILQPSCPIVIDTVDVHYSRLFLKYDLTQKSVDFLNAEETRRRELSIYRKADVVITVTDEDSDILERDCHGLTLRCIPTIHDVKVSNRVPEKNALVFVGGFNHDPNIDAMLYFCNEVLPILKRYIQRIKLTIVGSNPPEKITSLANDHVIVTGYVPSITPYLHASYVSVSPLRYGGGMKGKIGEAMAHGVPVVTTSIGAQGMGLINRDNSMIADSPEAFAIAIVELIENEELYSTVREKALKHVIDNYTKHKVEKRIASLMGEIHQIVPKKMRSVEKLGFFLDYTKKVVKKKYRYRRLHA